MGPVIENWVQTSANTNPVVAKQQKEHLQMFFLVLQVRKIVGAVGTQVEQIGDDFFFPFRFAIT